MRNLSVLFYNSEKKCSCDKPIPVRVTGMDYYEKMEGYQGSVSIVNHNKDIIGCNRCRNNIGNPSQDKEEEV